MEVWCSTTHQAGTSGAASDPSNLAISSDRRGGLGRFFAPGRSVGRGLRIIDQSGKSSDNLSINHLNYHHIQAFLYQFQGYFDHFPGGFFYLSFFSCDLFRGSSRVRRLGSSGYIAESIGTGSPDLVISPGAVLRICRYWISIFDVVSCRRISLFVDPRCRRSYKSAEG